jgi:alanine dehydrogenase
MENYQNLLPEAETLKGKKAILLLGTDRHIGEGVDDKEEKRVGVTPAQVDALKQWLQDLGIHLDFYFVQGAGVRAGHSDGDYLSVGGQLVFEHQLSTLPTPHVFHALKEPSPYEVFIPGPFIRIGALHTGNFVPTSVLASLFKKKNFCAIFDGSSIGGYAFQNNSGFKTPIKSSMSVFAGEIGADKVFELKKDGKVVISGGGAAGISAAQHLLDLNGKYTELIIVEPFPEQCQRLKNRFASNSSVQIIEGGQLADAHVAGASGLILAACIPNHPAPKVVDIGQLSKLADGAVIVDISIDEGGGISVPGIDVEVKPPQVIQRIESEITKFAKGLTYVADDHLPRKYPDKASESHGKAVLPYLAALLYLSAREGGASPALEYILKQDSTKTGMSHFDLLVCDLKNGLAFWRSDTISVSAAIAQEIVDRMSHFLESEKISHKVE